MSQNIKLKKIDTTAPEKLDKDHIKKENDKLMLKIGELQYKMAAQGKHSMLIILQGLDASGKDGTIKNVLSGVNPSGCMVQSFKVPTAEELSHDFLWRVHKRAPARGMIQVFNRSYYEDVLIPVLDKSLGGKKLSRRYEHINDFEELLADNDTTVLKFYLHVSSDVQKERLKERMTDPQKHWKHNADDRNKADKYDDMLDIYDDIFTECDRVPRHIIPADQNRYKVNQVCKVVLKALEDMDLKWPKLVDEGK